MNLKRIVRRHTHAWQVLIALTGLLTGVIAEIYVHHIQTEAWSSYIAYPNILWLILAAILVVLQYRAILLADSDRDGKEVIRKRIALSLEVTTRALIYPHSIDSYRIRAQVRLANRNTKKLEFFSQWSYPPGQEPTKPVAYDGPDKDLLTIAKVFTEGLVIAEDHSKDWYGGLSEENKFIRHDICSVLAAPIRDPDKPATSPIGIVSFDSNKTVAELHFDKPGVNYLAQLVADMIFPLVREFWEDMNEETQANALQSDS